MILSALINLRIIVPALQIIHPALCIEVVPSVAERVLLSYGRRHRAGNVYGPAPAVVFIIYNPLSGTVNQLDDVILGVSYVVVTGASDNHCNQACRAVVLVPDCLITGALGYKQVAALIIVVGHCLIQQLIVLAGQAVQAVVGVCYCFATFFDAGDISVAVVSVLCVAAL